MAGMTVETGSLPMGFMLAAHLGPMLIRMALQTETLRTGGQQMFVFTGMGIVAGGAIAVHNRFMHINGSGLFIDGLMTGETKSIRLLRHQQSPSLSVRMAGGTFAPGHGTMGLGLEQPRPF